MKITFHKFYLFFIILSTTVFIRCSSSNIEIPDEQTIEEKVALLESSEWLVKDFETTVMHTFVEGKKYTFYAKDGVFTDPIPGVQNYKITDEYLTIDFNFGNIVNYDLVFSCENTIVEFFENDELKSTLYKRGSNYIDCL